MPKTIDGVVYSDDEKCVVGKENKEITVANIKNGVTEIGRNAFFKCKNLKEISLPSSLVLIGQCAFKNCESLTTVKLADDFERLPSKWFNALPAQYEIICTENSKTYKAIKKSAILKMHVKSLSLNVAKSKKKKQVQTAGADAIISDALSSLSAVKGFYTIVNSRTTATTVMIAIGKNNGVFKLGTDSSKWLPKIPKIIEIFSDQTKSGKEIFDELVKNKITLGEISNPTSPLTLLADKDGNLNIFTHGTYKHCYLRNAKNVELYGAKKIGIEAFRSASAKAITIADGVETIEKFAFYQSEVERINLPEGITEIGNHICDFCYSLSSINIPSTVKKIGSEAFHDCTSLKEITLPKGIERIQEKAFKNSGIKDLGVTYRVTTNIIVDNTYKNVTDDFTIKDGLAIFGNKVLYDTTCDSNLNIPEGITEIATAAINHNDTVKRVSLPKSLKEIGDFAFFGCENLSKIDFAGNKKNVKLGNHWCDERLQ